METIIVQPPLWMNLLLGVVALCLLVMPLTLRWVEGHLELFLLAVGGVAVTISNGWSGELVRDTLSSPVYVSFIVVVVSIIFNNYSRYIFRVLFAFFRAFEPRYSFALLILILGMSSSLLSVTVSALLLAEVLKVVSLERKTMIQITVFACYAIALGAVLTPLAEPMGLVISNALAGAPHHADFFFLFRQRYVRWLRRPDMLPVMQARRCRCTFGKIKKTIPPFCVVQGTFICLWRPLL